MLPPLNSPRSRALAYAAVLASGWFLVFVLPWHVQSGTPAPAVSDSYVVGFDNRLAIVAVFMTALGMAAVSLLGGARRTGETRELFLAEAPPVESRVDRVIVAAFAAASAVASAAFIAITSGSLTYGEKSYFMDRMAYVLAGYVPFRDMEFTYGPLLAYWPVLIYRVLAPLGVSAELAYGVSWFIANVAGILVLAYVIDRLGVEHRLRVWLFVGLGVALWLNETVGLNEMLLRFVVPAAALLFLHGSASRLDTSTDRLGPLKLVVLGAVVSAACFALSPEMGVAALAAAAVYATAFAVLAGRRYVVAPVLLLLTPLAVVALTGPELFSHLLSMAGGALNFPVVPGPPVLALLAVMLAAAALLPRGLASAGRAQAPIVLAMTTLAAIVAVGALGRADTTHTSMYGLTALFLAVPLVAATSRRAAVALVAVFVAVVLAGHVLNVYGMYANSIVRAAALSPAVPDPVLDGIAVGLARSPGEARSLRVELRARPEAALSAFDTRTPVAAPLGFEDDLGLRLAERGSLASTYFRGVVFTLDQARRELPYLSRVRFAVVPTREAKALYGAGCGSVPVTSTALVPVRQRMAPLQLGRNYLTLLMWPEQFPQQRRSINPTNLVRQTLAREFVPVAETGVYTILERGTP